MQWWLGVAGDMRDYTLEYLRFVACRCLQLDIEILQLDLFPSKIIAKPAKLTPLIFLASFVREGMVLDSLAHSCRVLFQEVPHFESVLFRHPKSPIAMTEVATITVCNALGGLMTSSDVICVCRYEQR